MARDRRGRFTAERTTTTVTERVTVEAPPPMALPTDPAPEFARLLRHPPEDATWAHPDFIADEAARAVAGFRDHSAPFPDAPEPVRAVQVVTVPRTYRELEPATLDHEFTAADQERLAWTLGEGDYLP